MGRSKPQPRKGPSITDFLRYYVLSAATRRRRSVAGLISGIRKESACNRDYRPSGQLLIDEQELTGVLRKLAGQGLIALSGERWRLVEKGRRRLERYDKQKEENSDGKERAAQVLLEWMGRADPGERVLDVGTGEGYLAFKIAERGCRVLGIDSGHFDYSKDSVKSARDKAKSVGGYVDFRQVSITDLRGRNASFDHVVTSQAIHCMRDQRRCVKA